MNKNHGKDGKFISGGNGRKSTKSGNIPSFFQLDVSKMRKVKLPKELKKGGIDNPAYKKWIYENWT